MNFTGSVRTNKREVATLRTTSQFGPPVLRLSLLNSDSEEEARDVEESTEDDLQKAIALSLGTHAVAGFDEQKREKKERTSSFSGVEAFEKEKGPNKRAISLVLDSDDEDKMTPEVTTIRGYPNNNTDTNYYYATKNRSNSDVSSSNNNNGNFASKPVFQSPNSFSSSSNNSAKIDQPARGGIHSYASDCYYLNHLKDFPDAANPKTMRITDLITPLALSAILTTYKVDVEWLLEVCPVLQTIPVMLVHSEQALEGMPSKLGPKFHITKPPLPVPFGICHGKIMLIKYAAYLRVVVSTANLLGIDYNQKTQDFPLLDPTKQKKPQDSKSKSGALNLAADFQETLKDYIARMKVSADFIDAYCYDDVKVALITSVPGTHKDGDIPKYGHMKVRQYLRQYPLPEKFHSVPIQAQFSSLGSLTENWMNELYDSFHAHSGYINERGVVVANKKQKNLHLGNKFQLIWPTVDFVRNSINGYSSGGSLCFTNQNMKPFMKELFYEYHPTIGRQRVPPHIKTYTRSCLTVKGNRNVANSPDSNKKRKLAHESIGDDERKGKEKDETEFDLAWVILTSANLSKAAWGCLQKNNTQLFIRHYEAGILFLPGSAICKNYISLPDAPSENDENNELKEKKSSSGEDNGDGVITFPLPYRLPVTVKNNDCWKWDLDYLQEDILGEQWLPSLG